MKKIIFLFIITCTILFGSVIYTKTGDKEITIYTAQESEYIEGYLSEFRELHPEIKLNVVKESTGNITAKLLVEAGNPQADVIWNVAASSVLILEDEGLLYPYKPKGIELIDSKFYDTVNEVPTWVGTTAWGGAITVNVKEAEKKGIPIPKSYQDLLNPVYKNEIVMSDPVASGTGFLMLSSWLQKSSEDDGWRFMTELDKNIKQYIPSGSAPTRSTAIGEQVIGLGYDKESLKFEKTTPEIITVFPSDGIPWEVEAVALLKKDKIKKEAITFYEWAISKKTIEKYGENRTLTTLIDSKPSVEGIPENIRELLNKNDFIWAAKNKNRISLEWIKRFSNRG